MTKVSYDILFHGRKVKNVVGYQEACNIVAELGSGWRFKAVYREYDPNRTPEYIEACKAHAAKVKEAIANRGGKLAPC